VTAGVVADGQVGELVGGGDAAVESAGAFGGLRGVLRDVTGDLGICQLPRSRDRTGVVFAAPGQAPGGDSRSGGRDDGDGADRLVDGGGEQAEGGPGGRCSGWSGGAVEADDGVEVDDPAPLVFGDLGIRDPYLRAAEPVAGTLWCAGRCLREQWAKVVLLSSGPLRAVDERRQTAARRISDGFADQRCCAACGAWPGLPAAQACHVVACTP
jgi:hypothetical protein